MSWQPINTIPSFRFLFGYSPENGVEIINYLNNNQFADDYGIVSDKKYTHWQYLIRPKSPISKMPLNERVFAYCREYHLGPGREKQGIMQVYKDPVTGEIKDILGAIVYWNFTHWSYVEHPTEESNDA